MIRIAMLCLTVLVACDDRPKATADGPGRAVNGSIFVQFEGGGVQMGSGGPTISVSPFRIMRTEVTVADFKRCMAAGACTPLPTRSEQSCNLLWPDRSDHPMNCISWSEAQQYAEWFGHGARLPTEAEWVFAATSGRSLLFPWGDTPGCDRAVVADCSNRTTAPVCSRPMGSSANPQALCDMIGNVAEYVLDDWHEGYDCDNVQVPEGLVPRVPLEDACPNGGTIPMDGSAWVEAPPSAYKLARGGSYRASWSDASNHSRSVAHRDRGSSAGGIRLVIPGRP